MQVLHFVQYCCPAEGHLQRGLFGRMLRRINALLVPSG
jgi:hypothetical protein